MAAMTDLPKHLGAFSATLYGNIVASQNGKQINTLICPLSVYTALAMTHAGSRGSTEEEVTRALQLSGSVNPAELGDSLIHYWTTSGAIELNTANRLFLLRSVKIKEDFKSSLSKHYKSELESLGGLPNDETRRAHINHWVGKSTKEMIKELLPPSSINSNSILMLINALYFKGSWKKQFPVDNTRAGTFRKHDGSSCEVQMMSITDDFPYEELEDIGVQALRLPFHGDNSWELLIILPFGQDGLPEVQEYLKKPDNMKKLLSQKFPQRNLNVFLPRFRLSKCPMVDMVDMLKKMGVSRLFDPVQANLTGITDEMKLFVSGIYHQAVMEVDEKGATATAATAVRVSNRCMVPTVKVDRPFFVAIVQRGMIPVFLGHVWEPEPF